MGILLQETPTQAAFQVARCPARPVARDLLLRKVMKLRDIMKRDPITASELTRVGEAQRLMRTNGIRHMPVVRDGRLLGIVSERDLLAYHAALGADQDWWRARVTDVMSTPAQTA